MVGGEGTRVGELLGACDGTDEGMRLGRSEGNMVVVGDPDGNKEATIGPAVGIGPSVPGGISVKSNSLVLLFSEASDD